MNLRTLVAIAAIAPTAVFGAGCDTEAAEQRGDRQPPPSPVETLVVEPTEFVDAFQVPGTIDSAESVAVSSDLPGQILNVWVDEGDAVDRGDRLFRIDTESDEAQRDTLETQVEAAEREFDRIEELYEQGLATRQQLDNAETELKSARQNLRQTDVTLGRNIVRSPISGRVATRYADRGEYAAAGNPLVEIVDLDPPVVTARVPESELQYVEGDDARNPTAIVPAVGDEFDASVERVDLVSSAASRTWGVELHLEESPRQLRPGMRTSVRFERTAYDAAIVIPRDSILEGYDTREVMVVPGEDDVANAEVRRIHTGPGTRDEVLVESGLDPGDRLVVRGHRGLIGDARVEVVEQRHMHAGDDE